MSKDRELLRVALLYLRQVNHRAMMEEKDNAVISSLIDDITAHLSTDDADARDAARYRWLRTHFRFANDSVREIWFDPNIDLVGAYGAHEPDELDASIDAAMKSDGKGR